MINDWSQIFLKHKNIKNNDTAIFFNFFKHFFSVLPQFKIEVCPIFTRQQLFQAEIKM